MDKCLIGIMKMKLMMLFKLEPEVAGGMGKNTMILDSNVIAHLHYEFSGWLGDEILETTPCFIITYTLMNSIKRKGLMGVKFDKVEISTTDEFKELYPNKKLPQFMRLIPEGTVHISENKINNWSGDDFCLSQNNYLVVSESALLVLRKLDCQQ